MNVTESQDGDPYVGRHAFTLARRQFFAGRRDEIAAVQSMWQGNRVAALHGPAGAGKTSLLQAGVIPPLAGAAKIFPPGKLTVQPSFPEPLLADHNPFAFSVLASWSPAASPGDLAQQSITMFLRRVRQRVAAASSILVAIDQFEKLLATDHETRGRDEFLSDLAEATRTVPGVRLLLVTRTADLAGLARLGRQLLSADVPRFELNPMSPQAALEAVRYPARKERRSFGSGAAEYVVDQLSTGYLGRPRDAVEPAQLQVVCSELWRLLPAEMTVVTARFVRDALDVDRVIADFYATAVAEASQRHGLARGKLSAWLAERLGETGDATRAVRTVTSPADVPDAVLRTLEDEHILVSDTDVGVKRYRIAGHLLAIAAAYDGQRPSPRPLLRNDSAGFLRFAESALAEGDFALAREHAEAALDAADPADFRYQASLRTVLGNIAYRMNQPDEAEKNYKRAAGLREQLGDRPEVGRLYGAIGCMYARRDRYLDALEEFQVAVNRLPSDLSLQTELATALWHVGQSQAAVAVFGAVLSLEPESADALAGIMQIRAERGHAKAALDDLRNLQRLWPDASLRPDVRSAYALALAVAGQPDTAMAEADAAVASTHDSAVVFLRAAQVALASGAHHRTVELLRLAEDASHPALSVEQRSQVRRLRNEASSPVPGAD